MVAACCGVAVPALIFVVANRGTDNLGGWAVPAATDIAFALAILAVVGSALPTPLRAFLLTLAVVDDLIVIVVIAVFYTSTIHLTGLLVAVGRVRGVRRPPAAARPQQPASTCRSPWSRGRVMYESGVHATIAGVVLGLLTRVLPDDGRGALARRAARAPARRRSAPASRCRSSR